MFDSVKRGYRMKIYRFYRYNIQKLSYLTEQIMLSKQHNSVTLSNAINQAIIRHKD